MSSSTSDALLRTIKRGKQPDHLGRRITRALELIAGVLDDLSEEATAISFNGGKDCTVLLHLFAAALYSRHSSPSSSKPNHSVPNIPSDPTQQPNGHSRSSFSPSSGAKPQHQSHAGDPSIPTEGPSQPIPSPSTSSSPLPLPLPYPPIKAIYISSPSPFPVLESFIAETLKRYQLDLHSYGGGMKSALGAYLSGPGEGVRAVLVGTRRTDPNGDVDELAPTDPSWPAFLRVHPILDWSYADVWAFLRDLDVSWCHLYDDGYTSLGSTTNTVRNPLLRSSGSAGGWDPAWMLNDPTQERAGRLDTSS